MKPRSPAPLALLALVLVGCGGADRYQSMDAEALYQTAQAEYEEGSYGNAIDALERLMVTYQTFDRLAEGRFLLAESYFHDGQYVTSRSEYQRFLDRYVGHDLAAAAALGACKSLERLSPRPQRDQTFTREAITTCGNVIVDYAGTPAATEAAGIRQQLRQKMAEKEYLNARHYLRRKQYDPSIKYFQFVIDLYPETSFAAPALLGIYRANVAIGYDDLADEARSRLLREYPDSEAAQELQSEDPEP
jgi:outer membrane protein assembly factor BamD